MPGLSLDIIQHKLPLNPDCSLVKQKLRRMNHEMSLKKKEGSEEAIRRWFLGRCSVPGVGHQYHVGP